MLREPRTRATATSNEYYRQRRLFARPELRRVDAGTVLFEQGDESAGVYILHSGVVAIVPVSSADAPIRRAHAGDIVGVADVFAGSRHRTAAVALTHCEVAFIERVEFMTLIDDSPAMRSSIRRQLARDRSAADREMLTVRATPPF